MNTASFVATFLLVLVLSLTASRTTTSPRLFVSAQSYDASWCIPKPLPVPANRIIRGSGAGIDAAVDFADCTVRISGGEARYIYLPKNLVNVDLIIEDFAIRNGGYSPFFWSASVTSGVRLDLRNVTIESFSSFGSPFSFRKAVSSTEVRMTNVSILVGPLVQHLFDAQQDWTDCSVLAVNSSFSWTDARDNWAVTFGWNKNMIRTNLTIISSFVNVSAPRARLWFVDAAADGVFANFTNNKLVVAGEAVTLQVTSVASARDVRLIAFDRNDVTITSYSPVQLFSIFNIDDYKPLAHFIARRNVFTHICPNGSSGSSWCNNKLIVFAALAYALNSTLDDAVQRSISFEDNVVTLKGSHRFAMLYSLFGVRGVRSIRFLRNAVIVRGACQWLSAVTEKIPKDLACSEIVTFAQMPLIEDVDEFLSVGNYVDYKATNTLPYENITKMEPQACGSQSSLRSSWLRLVSANAVKNVRSFSSHGDRIVAEFGVENRICLQYWFDWITIAYTTKNVTGEFLVSNFSAFVNASSNALSLVVAALNLGGAVRDVPLVEIRDCVFTVSMYDSTTSTSSLAQQQQQQGNRNKNDDDAASTDPWMLDVHIRAMRFYEGNGAYQDSFLMSRCTIRSTVINFTLGAANLGGTLSLALFAAELTGISNLVVTDSFLIDNSTVVVDRPTFARRAAKQQAWGSSFVPLTVRLRLFASAGPTYARNITMTSSTVLFIAHPTASLFDPNETLLSNNNNNRSTMYSSSDVHREKEGEEHGYRSTRAYLRLAQINPHPARSAHPFSSSTVVSQHNSVRAEGALGVGSRRGDDDDDDVNDNATTTKTTTSQIRGLELCGIELSGYVSGQSLLDQVVVADTHMSVENFIAIEKYNATEAQNFSSSSSSAGAARSDDDDERPAKLGTVGLGFVLHQHVKSSLLVNSSIRITQCGAASIDTNGIGTVFVGTGNIVRNTTIELVNTTGASIGMHLAELKSSSSPDLDRHFAYSVTVEDCLLSMTGGNKFSTLLVKMSPQCIGCATELSAFAMKYFLRFERPDPRFGYGVVLVRNTRVLFVGEESGAAAVTGLRSQIPRLGVIAVAGSQFRAFSATAEDNTLVITTPSDVSTRESGGRSISSQVSIVTVDTVNVEDCVSVPSVVVSNNSVRARFFHGTVFGVELDSCAVQRVAASRNVLYVRPHARCRYEEIASSDDLVVRMLTSKSQRLSDVLLENNDVSVLVDGGGRSDDDDDMSDSSSSSLQRSCDTNLTLRDGSRSEVVSAWAVLSLSMFVSEYFDGANSSSNSSESASRVVVRSNKLEFLQHPRTPIRVHLALEIRFVALALRPRPGEFKKAVQAAATLNITNNNFTISLSDWVTLPLRQHRLRRLKGPQKDDSQLGFVVIMSDLERGPSNYTWLPVFDSKNTNAAAAAAVLLPVVAASDNVFSLTSSFSVAFETAFSTVRPAFAVLNGFRFRSSSSAQTQQQTLLQLVNNTFNFAGMVAASQSEHEELWPIDYWTLDSDASARGLVAPLASSVSFVDMQAAELHGALDVVVKDCILSINGGDNSPGGGGTASATVTRDAASTSPAATQQKYALRTLLSASALHVVLRTLDSEQTDGTTVINMFGERSAVRFSNFSLLLLSQQNPLFEGDKNSDSYHNDDMTQGALAFPTVVAAVHVATPDAEHLLLRDSSAAAAAANSSVNVQLYNVSINVGGSGENHAADWNSSVVALVAVVPENVTVVARKNASKSQTLVSSVNVNAKNSRVTIAGGSGGGGGGQQTGLRASLSAFALPTMHVVANASFVNCSVRVAATTTASFSSAFSSTTSITAPWRGSTDLSLAWIRADPGLVDFAPLNFSLCSVFVGASATSGAEGGSTAAFLALSAPPPVINEEQWPFSTSASSVPLLHQVLPNVSSSYYLLPPPTHGTLFEGVVRFDRCRLQASDQHTSISAFRVSHPHVSYFGPNAQIFASRSTIIAASSFSNMSVFEVDRVDCEPGLKNVFAFAGTTTTRNPKSAAPSSCAASSSSSNLLAHSSWSLHCNTWPLQWQLRFAQDATSSATGGWNASAFDAPRCTVSESATLSKYPSSSRSHVRSVTPSLDSLSPSASFSAKPSSSASISATPRRGIPRRSHTPNASSSVSHSSSTSAGAGFASLSVIVTERTNESDVTTSMMSQSEQRRQQQQRTPFVAAVVAATDASAYLMMAGSAAGSSGPLGARFLAVQSVLLGYADGKCSRVSMSDDEVKTESLPPPPPRSQSLFHFKIDGGNGYDASTILSALVVCSSAFVALNVWHFVSERFICPLSENKHTMQKKHTKKKHSPSPGGGEFSIKRNVIDSSSLSGVVFFVTLYLDPCLSAAVMLPVSYLRHAEGTSLLWAILGPVLVGLVIVLPLIAAIATNVFNRQDEHRDVFVVRAVTDGGTTPAASADFAGLSTCVTPIKKSFLWLFAPKGDWTYPTNIAPHQQKHKQKPEPTTTSQQQQEPLAEKQFELALPLIEPYTDSFKKFIAVEVAVLMLLAVANIAGEALHDSRKGCVAKVVMMIVVLALYLIVALYYRPFQERVMRLIVPAMTCVQLSTLVVILVTDGAGSEAQLFMLLAASVQGPLSFLMWCYFVSVVVGDTVHRFKIYRSRAHGDHGRSTRGRGGGRRGGHADDLYDEGADEELVRPLKQADDDDGGFDGESAQEEEEEGRRVVAGSRRRAAVAKRARLSGSSSSSPDAQPLLPSRSSSSWRRFQMNLSDLMDGGGGVDEEDPSMIGREDQSREHPRLTVSRSSAARSPATASSPSHRRFAVDLELI